VQAGSLSEGDAARLGSIAELLVGLTGDDAAETDGGDAAAEPTDLRTFVGDEGTWSVVDVIPPGEMCVVVLIEHRWSDPSQGRGSEDRRLGPLRRVDPSDDPVLELG
jgi:hypothetical protein